MDYDEIQLKKIKVGAEIAEINEKIQELMHQKKNKYQHLAILNYNLGVKEIRDHES